jgi:flagellar protein FliJ
VQLEDARHALNEAFEEMKKAEQLGERDQMRERAEDNIELDALGIMRNGARA